MERYSIVTDKNPREIILLRGRGCVWKKCTFCDYHYDASRNLDENFLINKNIIEKVTGLYSSLEIINSGSFFELDEKTIDLIFYTCKKLNIKTVHTEVHWLHKNKIPKLRSNFSNMGIKLVIKTGLETFDYEFRENVLKKGINTTSIKEIRSYVDEICLLFGLNGQSLLSMKNDIELGLKYFDRICINIMTKNSTPILPNDRIIRLFMQNLYPLYKSNQRVDILLNNIDFGVGK